MDNYTANDSITFQDHRDHISEAKNVLFPLIAGLGIIANAFVILVIVVTERSRSNRTVANTFVMNLAIADIIFLIMLPFHMPKWHQNGYPYPEAMCIINEGVKHISYHSSILFLTGMSVDRYMAIVHSLRSLEFRTQRNARIACTVLWLASIITTIPIFLYVKVVNFGGTNGTAADLRCVLAFPGQEQGSFVSVDDLYDELYKDLSGDYGDYLGYGEENMGGPDYNTTMEGWNALASTDHENLGCDIHGHGGNNSPSFRFWTWFTFAAFFLLPIVIVCFCYYKIWRATAIRKVRSQKADGNQEQQSLQPQQNSEQNPQKQSWKQIQYKVTIMVAVLVSAFILSWLPFQIWILLTLPPAIKLSTPYNCGIVTTVVNLLAWTNSLMNPILYSITSENFRKRATTTLFFLRYGYRRTMRMSVTRSSRTGFGYRTEKTDMILQSVPPGTSPKNDHRSETQISPPPTPISDGPPGSRF